MQFPKSLENPVVIDTSRFMFAILYNNNMNNVIYLGDIFSSVNYLLAHNNNR